MRRPGRGASRTFLGFSLEQIIAETSKALVDFPDLRISQGERFPVVVEGKIVLSGSMGPFDSFEVRIEFNEGFPFIGPRLFETAGRIPHTLDRHMLSDGSACLEVWEAWLAHSSDWSISTTLSGPIRNFLLSQSVFEHTDNWPFGEHAHGQAGQLDAIKAILDPASPDTSRLAWLLETLVKWPAGHNQCPCGSANKFRDCHRPELEEVRAKYHPVVLQLLHRVIQRAEKV